MKDVVVNSSQKALDGTGRVCAGGDQVHLFSTPSDIHLICYDRQPGHSLWRSQELTLLKNFLRTTTGPYVDVGCGDGSFGKALSRKLDWGVDPDPIAIEKAKLTDAYRFTACTFDPSTAVDSRTAALAISNSVLEHVDGLNALLAQIAEILALGGRLGFTVPLKDFTRQVTIWRGRKYASNLNARWSHRNLMSVPDWEGVLGQNSFKIIDVIQYQPLWVTGVYLGLANRGAPSSWFTGRTRWQRWIKPLAAIVGKSLHNVKRGANGFFVCERC